MDDPLDRKKMTPEERLFRIIQSQEKKQSQPDASALSEGRSLGGLASSKGEASLQVSVGGTPSSKKLLKNTLKDLFTNKIPSPSFKNIFSLSLLNRGLGLFLIIFCIYFAADAFFLRGNKSDLFMKSVNATVVSNDTPMGEVFLSVSPVDPGVILRRNAFRPWVAPERKSEPTPVVSASSVALLPPVGNLKLSGIYLGDISEALIESIDEKRTYAVRAGSDIIGLTVKEVKASSVILTNGKEDFLLQ